MKAFWTFAQRIQDADGVNKPDLPNVQCRWTSPGDLIRTGVTAGHRHLVVGGFALADDNLIGQAGEGHTHIVARLGDQWQQVTRGASHHAQPLPECPSTGALLPDYYMLFVVCSDAGALQIAAHPGCYPIVEADVTEVEDGLDIGDLDYTAWDAGDLATWQARCLSVLGFELPSEIDRGKRLVVTFLGALLSRSSASEKGLRYTA